MVQLRLREGLQPALGFLQIAGLERREHVLKLLLGGVEWMRR
jgi:hypothetical protein